MRRPLGVKYFEIVRRSAEPSASRKAEMERTFLDEFATLRDRHLARKEMG